MRHAKIVPVRQKMAEGVQPQTCYEPEPAALPRITFVVPSRGSSGGIRVTMEMANRLLQRGREVRIVYRSSPTLSFDRLVEALKTLHWQLTGGSNNDWLRRFRGPLVRFSSLADLDFDSGEIVVAVGTFTIQEVGALNRDVLKLRFCHGFREDLPELTHMAWGTPMATITVSSTLSPRIRELTGADPVAVIPNAISPEEYYVENRLRDGIGTVFSRNFKKDPETTLHVLEKISRRWPHIPLYVFGADPRPRELPEAVEYVQNPPLEKAREMYNRSLIWLVASRSEGFCLPILEAMACGCCVISTNHDSAPGLVADGVNGFLVPVGGVDAFMQRIEVLLDSPARRLEVVAEGAQTAKRYSWDEAVEKMEKFLVEFHGPAKAAGRPAPEWRNGKK